MLCDKNFKFVLAVLFLVAAGYMFYERFVTRIWRKDMEAKIVTRVLSFFGPPGTGKGTIAQRCVKELGFVMLSTGDLVRKHIQDKTDLGKTFQDIVNKGQLVPDDLITQMVLGWLKGKLAPGKTIILDGFPRTKGQADLLLQAFKDDADLSGVIFKVVNFDLSEDEIVKRISSRLVCGNKSCQEVYSTLVKRPKEEGVCDLCGSELIRRKDDGAEVVRERLNVFNRFKEDLLGFYRDARQEILEFPIPDGNPDLVYDEFKKLLD